MTLNEDVVILFAFNGRNGICMIQRLRCRNEVLILSDYFDFFDNTPAKKESSPSAAVPTSSTRHNVLLYCLLYSSNLKSIDSVLIRKNYADNCFTRLLAESGGGETIKT